MSAKEPSTPQYQVDLEPVGRRVQVGSEATLLKAAQEAGVELVAVCGGAGSCGTCRVRLASGNLSPPSLVEQAELSASDLSEGMRLACQASPRSDVRVDIPPDSLTAPQRLQIEGLEFNISVDPLVTAVDLQVDPPSLFDLRSDESRVQSALSAAGRSKATFDLALLAELPGLLRQEDWSLRLAVRDNQVVALLPLQRDLLGLAVDIGTTKLAAYLVDLASGVTLAKSGAMNPQIAYGEDVVSRIAYACQNSDGRQVLQEKLVETLNQLVGDLCMEVGIDRDQIVEAVAVGNTAMHHLFCGLPVRQLGLAPYVPVVSDPLEMPARDIGLDLASGALLYLPANIAGYVGADHVAMLLAVELFQNQGAVIALDIGTNTEITLALETQVGRRLLSCSCASGPAFEGAHIHDGMRAAPGAIERVQITNGEVRLHTIAGERPVGICGSGILDAVAGLLDAGVLDRRGVLGKDHPGVRQRDGCVEYLLAPAGITGHGRDLVVTRQDVNEIQLAKGAIRAGIEILLRDAGLQVEDIEMLIVAGAFGTYLDMESAIRVGMFPNLPRERFHQVGNAAGMGAKQMLISSERRRLAAEYARDIEYIELTTHPSFTEEFVRALVF
jgi:uncharacterized 2Fe-2S/4Fe-4S cluster protein (DUF4445 family)